MSNARKPTKRASARISRSSEHVHAHVPTTGAVHSQVGSVNNAHSPVDSVGNTNLQGSSANTPRTSVGNVRSHASKAHNTHFRAATTSASKTGGSRSAKTAKRKSVKSSSNKVVRIIGIVFIVLLALTTAAMAWNHWLRYDDTLDIQGEWKIEGTDSTIVFTENEIKLTDSVAYAYELDTFAKTITFSFHSLQGSGSYAFSPERDALIISEKDATGATETIPSKLIKVSGVEPQDLTNNPDDEASTVGADIVAEGENGASNEGKTNDGNKANSDSSSSNNKASSEQGNSSGKQEGSANSGQSSNSASSSNEG